MKLIELLLTFLVNMYLSMEKDKNQAIFNTLCFELKAVGGLIP